MFLNLAILLEDQPKAKLDAVILDLLLKKAVLYCDQYSIQREDRPAIKM